jgi:DNA-binding transcriptional LysR family regulator
MMNAPGKSAPKTAIQHLSLRQLDAFRAVVLTGSVSKAAERMFISQPAVSRLIADLERAVGFRLFARDKRFQLAEEGKLLYREVERAYIGTDKIAQRAEEIRDFRTGHLRIAASPAISLGLLPDVFKEFRDTYSDVTLSAQVRASQSVAEWVASGQIEVGFVAPPINQSGIIIKALEPLPALCLVPRQHRLAAAKVITPQLLISEDVIALGAESLLRQDIDRAFETSGVPRSGAIETTMSAHAAMLALKGLGIAVIDPFTALAFQERDLLLKPFYPIVPYEFALVLPANIAQSRLALAFIDMSYRHIERLGRQIRAAYDKKPALAALAKSNVQKNGR